LIAVGLKNVASEFTVKVYDGLASSTEKGYAWDVIIFLLMTIDSLGRCNTFLEIRSNFLVKSSNFLTGMKSPSDVVDTPHVQKPSTECFAQN
jgi:hypothetical protein